MKEKEDGEKIPLKTILTNFLNHVETLEVKREEGEDLYEKEFQVRVTFAASALAHMFTKLEAAAPFMETHECKSDSLLISTKREQRMNKISNDKIYFLFGTTQYICLIFALIFEGFERFHKVLVGLKKRRRKDEEQRESTNIKNCNLPKAAWIEYPAKLLVIGGLLLQPILGLSSPRRRALLELLPSLGPNSPERTYRPLVVSLLSGSAILGGDTVGKDLG